MKNAVSKVAIVGRANVGKSTLFNRLSMSVRSLTLDYAGVTRDVVSDVTCWKDACFELIDTGGLQVGKLDDELRVAVSKKAREIIEQSDCVLFLCDGTVGVLPQDREIGRELHKAGKKVVLVINKIDSPLTQTHEYEFTTLGFTDAIFISATHGTNINDVLDALVAQLPKDKKEIKPPEPEFKIVLLGKPNVGKSSLLNLLLKQERAIVSDIPGTTREAIAHKVTFYHEDIVVTDTPGIRRKKAVKDPLETMMVRTAFRALKDADIVLLLIDASVGGITDQELKLAFYAFEEGKALILLFNKQDLVDEYTAAVLKSRLKPYEHLLDKIVTLSISCKTGKNVGKILPLVKELWQRHIQEFSGQELSILFKKSLDERPLYHKTQLLKLIYAKQTKKAPITIALRVNQPEWFEQSQLSFFENIMRKNYDLRGVPIKFVVRKND